MTKQAKSALSKSAGAIRPAQKPLDKQGFLDSMGEVFATDVFPDSWTSVEVEKAHGELFDRRFMSGLWSKIPRTCSPECPHDKNGQCKLSNKPRKQRCPEEAAFVELLMRRYIESLDVPEDDMASISMIRDLVDIEIQLMRKQGILASSELVIMQTIAVDRQGREIQALVENPIVATDEKLKKRKAEIMKTLVATRESKIKLATDIGKVGELARATDAFKKATALMRNGALSTIPEDFRDDFIDAVIIEDDPEE